MKSQPFRRGDVYCLPNFTSRAELWYEQETIRQTGKHILEGPSRGGSRRQPSRTAKTKPVAEGPYVLSSKEVDDLRIRIGSKDGGQTPPPEGDEIVHGRTEMKESDFNLHRAFFRTRLSKAVNDKTRQLKARYGAEGIRHICTTANSRWQCLDEEYCAHGLVERSMRWVPKDLEQFQPRVRAEMDEYIAKSVFALEASRDRADILKELKRNRYAKLKKVTLATIQEIEAEWQQRPMAMVDAFMLETPTLGRWPLRGFVREDVTVQTVAFAGLIFAVDVCQGETRLKML